MKMVEPKMAFNRCAAFSLIEMMVVVFIIALLAAIGVAMHTSVIGKRFDVKIRSEMAQIILAIEAYKEKNGYFPPDDPLDPLNPADIADPKENGLFKNLNDESFKRLMNPAMKTGYEKDLLPNLNLAQYEGDHLVAPAPNPVASNVPNRWRYISLKPKFNTAGFDLWAEYKGPKGLITIGNWKH